MSLKQIIKPNSCLGCYVSSFFLFPSPKEPYLPHYMTLEAMALWSTNWNYPGDLITGTTPSRAVSGGSTTEGPLQTQRKEFTYRRLGCILQFPSRGHPPPSDTHILLTKSQLWLAKLNPLEIYIRCQTRLRDKSNSFGWKIAHSTLLLLVYWFWKNGLVWQSVS